MVSNVVNSVPVIISSVGLEEGEYKVLLQAIDFIRDNGIACRYISNESKEGHIVVVDTETDSGKSALDQLRPGQVKLLFSVERMLGKNLVSLAKPIKLPVLKTLLERICSQLEIQLATATSKQNEGKVASSGEEDHRTLFHVLYDAKCAQKTLKINVNGYPGILVNGLTNSIVTDASQEELKAILSTSKGAAKVEEISIVDIPSTPTDTVNISPLDNSLWTAGLLWRSGKLIAGCGLNQPVKLKAWPNFTRNNFFPEHLKLSAALAVQAMSLKKLHEMTQIPLEEIICFFNAAYAVGLIDIEPEFAAEPPKEAKQPNERRRGLLSRLAHRFGLS